jgi:hypothetical protein
LSYTHLGSNGASSNIFRALFEPSFHLPIGNQLFAFLGLGMGPQFIEHAGTGFTFVPRVGVNIKVGKSGVFTPSLSLVYSSQTEIPIAAGVLNPATVMFGVGIGYTVLF